MGRRPPQPSHLTPLPRSRTITKSDLLGHLLPMMSYDWAHLGITHLFHNIQANGYRMMFLSSRAIAQVRHFLCFPLSAACSCV